jgi:class 3 adenylate cyclase
MISPPRQNRAEGRGAAACPKPNSHELKKRAFPHFARMPMQARIADQDLTLKRHMGPSVVVTLNDRLDYFRSTVNMAARLQARAWAATSS